MDHAPRAAPNLAAHATLEAAILLVCAEQWGVDVEDESTRGEYAQNHLGIALSDIVKD